MKKFRKAQRFLYWKAMRCFICKQRHINRLVNINDQVINMALQGYSPQVKSVKALIRQAKKRGIIIFKKKDEKK